MKSKGLVATLILFTSTSTLLCCALPALFVGLGFGAAFAGLIGNVPQLIWISEHKTLVFSFGALMLALGGLLQIRARNEPCPMDLDLRRACLTTRSRSQILYFISLGLYSVGAFFAFLAPRFL